MLYAKLLEKLCSRIRALIDEGTDYAEVKCALLRSVGETVAAYRSKLFSLTVERFKAMSADQFLEHVYRLLEGLFQRCKTVSECIFVLARAITRQYLPNSGRLFLENRQISDKEELREGLDDWLSTRMKGDFFKPVGGRPDGPWSSKFANNVSEGRTLTCFNCGKPGHRAAECCHRGANSQWGGAGSPNVDRVTSTGPKPRVATCFTCGKEGHMSPVCPEKGKIPKKEPQPARMNPVTINLPSEEKKNVVKGVVSGKEVEILIDSGADYGFVPKSLVPETSLCGKQCLVSGIKRNFLPH